MNESQVGLTERDPSKIMFTRRDFLWTVFNVAAALGAKSLHDAVTPSVFRSVVQAAVDAKSARFTVPISNVMPDANGLAGKIVKVDREKTTAIVDPDELAVSFDTSAYPMRTVSFQNPNSGDNRSLHLKLGVHGNLTDTVIPIQLDMPQSVIGRISIDSLPPITFLPAYRNVAKYQELRSKLIAQLQVNSRTDLLTLPIDIENDTGVKPEQIAGYLANYMNWVPLDPQNPSQPELISTDVHNLETEWLFIIASFGGEIEPVYQDFLRSMQTTDLAAASMALKVAIDKISKVVTAKKTKAIDPVDHVLESNVSRREFLFKPLKWLPQLVSATLTAMSVSETVKTIQGIGDVYKDFSRFYNEIPNPAELTPRGFRGVVDYLLQQDPNKLSLMTIDLLMRDLVSAYKTAVLYRNGNTNEYAVWGDFHANQIGELELSPEQILKRIVQFRDKFGSRILPFFGYSEKKNVINGNEETFKSYDSVLQLCTGTGYRLSYDNSSIINGKPEVVIAEVNEYLFPEIYAVFKDTIDSEK